jgi:hypothetical protein
MNRYEKLVFFLIGLCEWSDEGGLSRQLFMSPCIVVLTGVAWVWKSVQ